MSKSMTRRLALVLAAVMVLGLLPLVQAASATKNIKDDTGNTIQIPANPERIVALTPWVVEALIELGHAPVGRPSSANFSEAAKSIPETGSSYRPNFERIAAMKPDLIIGNRALHVSLLPKLQELGAPVLLYDIDNINDIVPKMKALSEIVNEPKKGEAFAKNFEARAAALKKKIPSSRPKVLILVGSADAFSVAKSNSYMGSMVEYLGAVNIAEGPEHRPGYTKMSMERIVEKNPDILIVVKPVTSAADTSKALPEYEKNPLWSSLKAVQNKRVYEVDPYLFFMEPGPKGIQAMEEMAVYLYPEVFKVAK